MYLVLEFLMLVSLGGLIAVLEQGLYEWVIILKIVTSLFFVLAGFCGFRKSGKNKKIALYIFLALCFSMAGDTFLEVDVYKDIMFILGVLSFAVAHIMFSIGFCKMAKGKKIDFAVAGLILGVLLAVICTATSDFQGLFPVIVGYAAVISFMVAKALSLWRCRHDNKTVVGLMMSGGVLFLISDIILFFNMFGTGASIKLQVSNLIIYYVGQMLQSHALNNKYFTQE